MSGSIPDGTRDGKGYWLQGAWHPDDEQYHRLYAKVPPHNLDLDIRALQDTWGRWCEDYTRLADRVAKLEGVLHEFGRHTPACASDDLGEAACDCGWTQALASVGVR